MTEEPSSGLPGAAVDNDVLIKTAAYRLINDMLDAESIGVLGAARYVVTGRLSRMELAGDRTAALKAVLEFIARATVLEPTEEELFVAAEIEATAQRRGLSLDAGESQLAAIIMRRDIPLFATGDKRAIRAFEALMDAVDALAELRGKLRCLEQIMLRYADAADPEPLAQAICAEPQVDKTLSICFRCFSPAPHGPALDRDGLASYINALRKDAPRVLEP